MHLSAEVFDRYLRRANTADDAFSLFVLTDTDTPEGEERAQIVFEKALKLTSTVHRAMQLWNDTDTGSKEERDSFAKALALATTQDGLQEICTFIENHGEIMNFRKELMQVFKKAEELEEVIWA